MSISVSTTEGSPSGIDVFSMFNGAIDTESRKYMERCDQDTSLLSGPQTTRPEPHREPTCRAQRDPASNIGRCVTDESRLNMSFSLHPCEPRGLNDCP